MPWVCAACCSWGQVDNALYNATDATLHAHESIEEICLDDVWELYISGDSRGVIGIATSWIPQAWRCALPGYASKLRGLEVLYTHEKGVVDVRGFAGRRKCAGGAPRESGVQCSKLVFPATGSVRLLVCSTAEAGVVNVRLDRAAWLCKACIGGLGESTTRCEVWPNADYIALGLFSGCWKAWSGLRDLDHIVVDPFSPGFAFRAAQLVRRFGVCVLPGVLSNEAVEQWRGACEHLTRRATAAARKHGWMPGSRGNLRFSFGLAHKTGHTVHRKEWATQIAGSQAVLEVLSALWGGWDSYRCLGAGGDCVLPSCNTYQRLHSDFGYHDTSVEPPFISVNYTLADLTWANGPTRFVLGTTRRNPKTVPSLQQEAPESLLSTLCPVASGSAIIRDVRCWHGGTPNVSKDPRFLPGLEYEPRSIPYDAAEKGRPLPLSVFQRLEPEAQSLCADLVAEGPVDVGLVSCEAAIIH